MLCEPVRDAGQPFVALDIRGFLGTLSELLLDSAPGTLEADDFDQWRSPAWMAARVLGSVPLREHLEADQVDRLLAKARRIPDDMGDRFWPLLRPLVALGHRPTLEKLLGSRPQRRERDLDAHLDEEGIRTPWLPRAVEDSILIAYATAEDPQMRGLAGWLATGTRSNDVYNRVMADVREGRAVLPGDELNREALYSHLVNSRAWQETTAPIFTLIASALAIAAAMVLVRVGLRRFL
jgi:hypothetical protein